MINILHVIDTTGPGGAETVYIELADKLRSENIHSIAIVRGSGWVKEQLECRGIETIVMETKGTFNLRFVCALFMLIRRRKVRLIQSHLLGANVYSALVGWLSRVPVIGTFHGMVDVGTKEHFRWAKLWLMNRGLKASICVSKALAEYIENNRLLNPKQNHIIYNGIDTERYRKAKDDSLRRQLKIPQVMPLVGCLGNIRPAKNYSLLIKAVASLKKNNSTVHAVIAGHQKPVLMNKLYELINRLEVSNHIHFIGHVENSALFLSQIDIFVLCSRSEGFSISTVEAMASELPVVATRCGGPEEIIVADQDGILIENNNSDAMAASIKWLLENRNQAKEYAKRATETARSRFSVDTMVACYKKIYARYLPNISAK